jgi:predicted DNA-binding antitoxin AbrB/MazE fold protein
MSLTIEATFDGEVFRPDEKVDLEPNTKVKLELIIEKKKKTGKPYSSFEYARSLKLDGPSDFSKNIDQYLYEGKQIEDGK